MSVASYTLDAGFLSSIEEVIDDARNGRMFILVDAEDRENEGDLVVPAQMATPDAINFMAMHGRGLICLALTGDRVKQLNLDLMARHNESRHQTAFTVSIEAKEGISTGISAQDRARTVSVAIDPTRGPDDIVTPGHVFPLIAREGGVLMRTGHTEAAVDIARLAGFYPAGVICEIMNDDGTMARMPDLIAFSQRHNLKVATIADLIAYRHKHDSIVRCVAENVIQSEFGGEFQMRVYRTTVEPSEEHIALVKGDITSGEPVLVRVHACNTLTDLVGVKPSGFSGSLLQKAMKAVSDEGRGVVVLIRDVWPMAISQSLQAEDPAKDENDDASSRLLEVGVGSQILHDLGVRDMVLLSNSPQKKVVGLEGYGLHITDYRKFD